MRTVFITILIFCSSLAIGQQGILGKIKRSPSQGVVLGNSTIASYLSQTAVADLVFTATEIEYGYQADNIAVPGHTINQQLTEWNAYANKTTVDWIIVEIGLNDLVTPSENVSDVISRYQALINDINTDKKADAKIIVATMTPAKQRYIDILGSTDGAAAHQKWLDLNTAIMGGGATPITGVHCRIDGHTAALNDGSGNLASEYEVPGTNDHIHETTAARQIIANYYRICLAETGFL